MTRQEKLEELVREGVEWTDATWNPIRGCSRVSEGCRECYAEKIAARFSGPGQPYHGLAVHTRSGEARWTGKVALIESALDLPLRWRRSRRIFVNSMSDLFHEAVPDEWIAAIFGVMLRARQHTFQILTKRPERMARWCQTATPHDCIAALAVTAPSAFRQPFGGDEASRVGREWPAPHIWLGISAEDQKTWDDRVELLGRTPAAMRWVSAEPLLGELDVGNAFDPPPDGSPYGRVDWLVVGGESGGLVERALVERKPCACCHGWRPKDQALAWVRSLRDQCVAVGVPFFFKQWGGPTPKAGGRALDGRTWEEVPT